MQVHVVCAHSTPVGMYIYVFLYIWKTVAILVSGIKVLPIVTGAGAVGLLTMILQKCALSKKFSRPRSERLWAPEE